MLPETWLAVLLRAHLGLTLGLLVVALLRRRWRRGVGAQLAYGLWLLPPGLALAAALPAPDSLRITLPSLQIDASGLAVAASGAPERAFVVQGAWLAGVALAVAMFVIRHHRYARALTRRRDATWRPPPVRRPVCSGRGGRNWSCRPTSASVSPPMSAAGSWRMSGPMRGVATTCSGCLPRLWPRWHGSTHSSGGRWTLCGMTRSSPAMPP